MAAYIDGGNKCGDLLFQTAHMAAHSSFAQCLRISLFSTAHMAANNAQISRHCSDPSQPRPWRQTRRVLVPRLRHASQPRTWRHTWEPPGLKIRLSSQPRPWRHTPDKRPSMSDLPSQPRPWRHTTKIPFLTTDSQRKTAKTDDKPSLFKWPVTECILWLFRL